MTRHSVIATFTGHIAYSVQSERSIPISHFVESIRNMRALPLVEERVVGCSSHDTANNWSEQWDDKVIVGCSEDLSTIDNGREQSRAEVSRRVDSLGN